MKELPRVSRVKVEEAAALVARFPGINKREISERLGVAFRSVTNVMCVACVEKLAVSVPGLRGVSCYFSPADAKAGAKRLKEVRAEEVKRQNAHAQAHKRMKMRLARSRPDGGELSDQPKRRHIPAGTRMPLPFVCTAPASVFHLGGML